jgi:hypothetical protein
MRSGLITLMTDFGTDDVFAGVMKGVIAGINPSAGVIDLTHAIPPFDILQAAVKLSRACRYFPRGTVHTVVVDPGVGSDRRIVCMESSGRLFLAPDNGVLTAVEAEWGRDAVFEVTNRSLFLPKVSGTFHGRDIFAPVAARLAAGLSPAELGPPAGEIRRIELPAPVQGPEGAWNGIVLWSDRFGNLVTNLRADEVLRCLPAGSATICIGESKIAGIHSSFSDAAKGEPVAVVGSFGAIEICVREGNAAESFGGRRGTEVVIRPSQRPCPA